MFSFLIYKPYIVYLIHELSLWLWKHAQTYKLWPNPFNLSFWKRCKHTNYGPIQPKYSTIHSEKGMVASYAIMGLHAWETSALIKQIHSEVKGCSVAGFHAVGSAPPWAPWSLSKQVWQATSYWVQWRQSTITVSVTFFSCTASQ